MYKSPPQGLPPGISSYLNTREAAAAIGVNPHTLRRWHRSGKLTAYRHPLTGYLLYDPKELFLLLKNVQTSKGNTDVKALEKNVHVK